MRFIKINSHSYSAKVDAIKKSLKNYDDLSFLGNVYDHFQTIRNSKDGIISNFPWCCFLALKWKFTEIPKKHTIQMNSSQFVKIINRIYSLQNEASDLHEVNKLLLSIRRMMINQMLYQTPMKIEFNTLARQYYWYCNYEGGYFEKSFNGLYGVSLKDYYKISAYFALLSCIEDGTESTFIPIKHYVIHLAPFFRPETIKAYLDLVTVKLSDLREFMSTYKDASNKQSEYFQDTPMLYKPMIRVDDGIIILSKHILRASLTALVPALLKEEYSEEYKFKFSKVLESYVGELLKELPSSVTTEKNILSLYKSKERKGKVVDFIIHEPHANVYIDSKAIEPEKTVKSSNSAMHIKGRLKNSFTKGVLQGQECCRIVNEINGKNLNENDSLIIVTHKDHFIPTGKMIEDVIDPNVFLLIEKKFGFLSIKKERIYYMTIDEFESLIDICIEKKISITSVIDACSLDDANTSTMKFNVMMHLHNISPEGIPDREILKKCKNLLFYDMIESMKNLGKIWNGKLEDYLYLRNYLSK